MQFTALDALRVINALARITVDRRAQVSCLLLSQLRH